MGLQFQHLLSRRVSRGGDYFEPVALQNTENVVLDTVIGNHDALPQAQFFVKFDRLGNAFPKVGRLRGYLLNKVCGAILRAPL